MAEKVFIGGSSTVKLLDETARQKLDELISENAEILIGDCRGADALVQDYLRSKNYERVTVYASDGFVRINHGNWPVVNVQSHGEKGYAYFQLKDIEMANDADRALMIWDGKSRGTFFNIQKMKELGKKAEVYITVNKHISDITGVFWVAEGKLLAFPFDKNKFREAISETGFAYNQEKLWNLVRPDGCDKAFNYYPRGIVYVKRNGKGFVFMNPNIDDKYINGIAEAFCMRGKPVIKYDYSEHYKCYLDK